jgi:hypothetical protein
VRGYHVAARKHAEVTDIHPVNQVVKSGGHGKILQAQGVFRESITERLTGYKASRYFHTSEQGQVRAVGEVCPGDECRSLYGDKDFYIFRRKGQYHELVGQAVGQRLQAACPPDLDFDQSRHEPFCGYSSRPPICLRFLHLHPAGPLAEVDWVQTIEYVSILT